MKTLICSMVWRFILIAILMVTAPVFASEHGSSAPAAPAPMQFLINVGDVGSTMKFLQVTVEFEFATPEASLLIAERKPKVQHLIILLLSDVGVEALQSVKGKKGVQEKIVKDLNALIKETVETGIKDVFFTSFIMQ